MNQSNGLVFQSAAGATDLNRMMKYPAPRRAHQRKANRVPTDTVDGSATVACDFESIRAARPSRAGYARRAEAGASRGSRRACDPLKFGFVSATDNHDGTMGNVGEHMAGVHRRARQHERRLTRNPFDQPRRHHGHLGRENTREARGRPSAA
jgi:hypothetical protein